MVIAYPILKPFYRLYAHAAIVVGAFPEAGLVVVEVYRAVGADAPVPLAVGVVDEVGFYKIPTA